jgi:hypothetical protein
MIAPKRVDGNQAALVAVYRRLGATWADTHVVGNGLPDGIVAVDGVQDLVEIKMPGAKLTPKEVEFHRDWPGSIVIVRTEEDVIYHVKEMREAARR